MARPHPAHSAEEQDAKRQNCQVAKRAKVPMGQGANKIWANALAIAVMGTAQQFFLVCKYGKKILP